MEVKTSFFKQRTKRFKSIALMRGVFMADSVVFAQLLLHTDWRKKQKTHAKSVGLMNYKIE